MYNFDPYNVLLSIATNTPVRLVLCSRVTYIFLKSQRLIQVNIFGERGSPDKK